MHFDDLLITLESALMITKNFIHVYCYF